MNIDDIKRVARLLTLVLLSGCARLSLGPVVRGSVGGKTIETRVDSQVARYYLTSYLTGKRADAALDQRIDSLYRYGENGGLPDRADLKRITDEFSHDLAALYLADRLGRIPANRRFRDLFDRTYDGIHGAMRQSRLTLPSAVERYEVLFVPGYLYRRATFTGADFAGPRAALGRAGLTQHFVETDEDAAVETNVDAIVEAVRARAHSGRRLIVITASKSSPELALALTRLGAANTRHVVAWINAVGALQGTPLADDRLLPELDNLVGPVDEAGMESLTTERSRRRFASFRIPDHLLVINYIGIPLTGSISYLARIGFVPLRKHGPNDGITLLSDAIFPGGITLAELGRDHFMLGLDIDTTTVALMMTVVRWLEDGSDDKSSAPAR